MKDIPSFLLPLYFKDLSFTQEYLDEYDKIFLST